MIVALRACFRQISVRTLLLVRSGTVSMFLNYLSNVAVRSDFNSAFEIVSSPAWQERRRSTPRWAQLWRSSALGSLCRLSLRLLGPLQQSSSIYSSLIGVSLTLVWSVHSVPNCSCSFRVFLSGRYLLAFPATRRNGPGLFRWLILVCVNIICESRSLMALLSTSSSDIRARLLSWFWLNF